MIDERTVLHQSERVAARIMDGAAVVVAIDQQELHTFNEVGTRVWELAEGRSVGEIVNAIVEEYEVERAEARRDVLGFVERLVELGVIEPEGVS